MEYISHFSHASLMLHIKMAPASLLKFGVNLLCDSVQIQEVGFLRPIHICIAFVKSLMLSVMRILVLNKKRIIDQNTPKLIMD